MSRLLSLTLFAICVGGASSTRPILQPEHAAAGKHEDNRRYGSAKEGDAGAESPAADDVAAEKSDYDYLLGMNLWSLTYEKVEEIKKQLEAKQQELDAMKKTSLEQLWDRDLDALVKALDEIDARDAADAAAAKEAVDGRKRKVRGKAEWTLPELFDLELMQDF